MDTNPFDPNENDSAAEDDEAAWAPQSPSETTPAADADRTETLPGVDRTEQTPIPIPAAPAPGQPKWQPLPGGSWGPPAAPDTPPAAPGAYGAQSPTGYGAPTPPGAGPYAGWGAQGSGEGQYGAPPFTPGGGYGAPTGHGAPGGPTGPVGPYAPLRYGDTAPEPPAPRRSKTGRYIATGVAIAALVAGATTAGVVLGRTHNKSTASAKYQPVPQPRTSQGAASTKLNVGAVAKKIDPATVDITSILSSQNAEAEGTGMILTSDGEVLTNNHVIEGASSITAQVDGVGTKYTVKVLGADPVHDVALVVLEGASNLPHVTIGNSSAVTVGDPVVAIGNALGLGGTPTVTSGIVSALGRQINATDSGSANTEHLTGLIQTDAPINPGNSGGPLVDAAGQVIGMDTAALSGSSTQTATNIGFAIPIDRAIAIATDIQQGKAVGSIVIGTHGIMGVDVESIQAAESLGGGNLSLPVKSGAAVFQVLNGSPAANAGISPGDVIVGFNGNTVTTIAGLGKLVSGSHAGQQVSVTWVDTSGTRHTASLTLEAGPAV